MRFPGNERCRRAPAAAVTDRSRVLTCRLVEEARPRHPVRLCARRQDPLSVAPFTAHGLGSGAPMRLREMQHIVRAEIGKLKEITFGAVVVGQTQYQDVAHW